jgi:Zn-dependent protease with chaperone function
VQFLERQQAAQERTRLFRLQFALVAIPAIASMLIVGGAAGYFLTFVEIMVLHEFGLVGIPFTDKALAIGACIHAVAFVPWMIRAERNGIHSATEELTSILAEGALDDPSLDPSFRKLSNVVEEMALAAGMPPPLVHIWPGYRAINSVTLGASPADAQIFVTRFAIDGLPRSELQALVAYSMSQILNGDMALNLRVASYVHAFEFGNRLGNRVLRPKGNVFFLKLVLYWLLIGIWLGLLLKLIAWPPYMGAKFLQSRIGRERQRLGDASVVQFTRDPASFVSLLTKAHAFPASVKLKMELRPLNGVFAHCCFVAPDQRRFFAIQDSLPKRIRTIDRNLQVAKTWSTEMEKVRKEYKRRVEEADGTRYETFRTRPQPTRRQEQVLAGLATLTVAASVKPAEDTRARLSGVVGEILALLMDRNPRTRGRQIEALGALYAQESLSELNEPLAALGSLAPAERSLALDRRLPVLRALSAADLAQFRRALDTLAIADESVDVFEFALTRSAVNFIDAFSSPRPPHGSLTFDKSNDDLCYLFMVMASFTSRDRAAVAYESGIRQLGLPDWAKYAQPASWAHRLAAVLGRLNALTPIAKDLLLESLAKTASFDGSQTLAERELVRAVAACLNCPLPRVVGANQ